MDIFKKVFLYIVGTVAVAYEEASKAIFQDKEKKIAKEPAKIKA